MWVKGTQDVQVARSAHPTGSSLSLKALQLGGCSHQAHVHGSLFIAAALTSVKENIPLS